MNSKGLDWDSYTLIINQPNCILSNEQFSNYITTINENINKGKAIQLNIFSKGNKIRMLNSNPDFSCTIRGGHAVFVTGINKSGFIVSSWGKEYLIPFYDLQNGGNFNITIDKVNNII